MLVTVRCKGFTLVELMIAVAIIGIIASVAIPNYLRFQLKSKSSEGKVNLAGIRTSEQAYFSETGDYLPASANPATIPGPTRLDFLTTNAGFNSLGWSPEGTVYFSYGVSISDGGTGFTADAGADIDANGDNQYWVYLQAGQAGTRAVAVVGCDTTSVAGGSVAPCSVAAGQSVF